MCGIVGVVSPSIQKDIFSSTCNIQNHRGPDYKGEFHYKINNFNLAFGHQRLSIIDLTSNANQPMVNNKTGSSIIFNGEIYNYLELKKELELEGIKFEGSGDTEVLFNALQKWGIEKTLKSANGMWSFAWLDNINKSLYLSRDRFGEKPLYYIQSSNEIIFASEIKSLLFFKKKRFELNFSNIKAYLDSGILNHNNETFFKDIRQVKPSHYLKIDLNNKSIISNEYEFWHCRRVEKKDLNFDDYVEKLDEVFSNSVKIRLRSDVPVGILLSGGIDSSAISAVASELSNENLTLLSGVSDNPAFDESIYIDKMQKHLKWPIIKKEIDNSPDNLFSLLHEATNKADMPLSSLSNLAHFNLMQSAKENNIKVVLSGQGADELLCGYRKFLPFFMQEKVQNLDFVGLYKLSKSFSSNREFLKQFNFADAKRYMPRLFKLSMNNSYGGKINHEKSIPINMKFGSKVLDRQIADLMKFSVPTLNHFEDRMSMAHSREIRLPFLDFNLVELLLSSPIDYKLKNGWTKYCFRHVMKNKLPADITWRRDKQGFINPQSEWIKNELKETIIRNYFNDDALIFKFDIFNKKNLLNKYDKFSKQKPLEGKISFKEIFYPLALEAWLRVFEEYITN
tara:strand:- start:9865 stop:11733 length:1869 start_codon:yes stop_codon:yes gene_type:complete